MWSNVLIARVVSDGQVLHRHDWTDVHSCSMYHWVSCAFCHMACLCLLPFTRLLGHSGFFCLSEHMTSHAIRKKYSFCFLRRLTMSVFRFTSYSRPIHIFKTKICISQYGTYWLQLANQNISWWKWLIFIWCSLVVLSREMTFICKCCIMLILNDRNTGK